MGTAPALTFLRRVEVWRLGTASVCRTEVHRVSEFKVGCPQHQPFADGKNRVFEEVWGSSLSFLALL
jgi:hypothetical protein